MQNGADAVYLGVSDFNARYSAKNFTLEELEKAIQYAHLRNVKVLLTLNTLIKNEELKPALEIASKAYSFGIDGIIVQDIGLATLLIQNFPDLPVHASTQMTCHNLSGVKKLETVGFRRIVLARELSLSEIQFISNHTQCELEVFIHGALCISYSGQCLYSSLIGGRSGNRGKCAQGCRLPYTLLENGTTIDSGYLLSPKDLCSLELLPKLLPFVHSLKIEGRMKTPEYVATVTRIYRKYIQKILNKEEYIVEEQDKKDLMQVFNRGGFSKGHLEDTPNRQLIYSKKSNNMGIAIGNVSNYQESKGHIMFTTNEKLMIGDTITFEKENTKYTISELMEHNQNLTIANIGQKVTIGRMKGNIHPGDKIYKLTSKELENAVKNILGTENIKRPLHAVLTVQLKKPIALSVFDTTHRITVTSDEIPEVAMNMPITEERLKQQLNKLTDTPFFFQNIQINLDKNLFIPHIRAINELRRSAIEQISQSILEDSKRKEKNIAMPLFSTNNSSKKKHKVCVLLNQIHTNYDYRVLKNIDKLYIPLSYFCKKEYQSTIQELTDLFPSYIYMPNILKPNYRNLLKETIQNSIRQYAIKGFVVSNIGNFNLLQEFQKKFEFIGNYTFNVFNSVTIDQLPINIITISPELNKEEINAIASLSSTPTEFIVYGNLPLMTSGYCLLGKTNRCYPECSQKCKTTNFYYLKDRMNFLFRIMPDNLQTVTTIYNSRITSIAPEELPNVDNYRIDILEEEPEEINQIIQIVKGGKRLEGKNYTNGNFNRIV